MPAVIERNKKFELLLEAESRGILPESELSLLNEARNRGLVPPLEAPETPPVALEAPPEPIPDISLQKEAPPTMRERLMDTLMQKGGEGGAMLAEALQPPDLGGAPGQEEAFLEQDPLITSLADIMTVTPPSDTEPFEEAVLPEGYPEAIGGILGQAAIGAAGANVSTAQGLAEVFGVDLKTLDEIDLGADPEGVLEETARTAGSFMGDIPLMVGLGSAVYAIPGLSALPPSVISNGIKHGLIFMGIHQAKAGRDIEKKELATSFATGFFLGFPLSLPNLPARVATSGGLGATIGFVAGEEPQEILHRGLSTAFLGAIGRRQPLADIRADRAPRAKRVRTKPLTEAQRAEVAKEVKPVAPKEPEPDIRLEKRAPAKPAPKVEVPTREEVLARREEGKARRERTKEARAKASAAVAKAREAKAEKPAKKQLIGKRPKAIRLAFKSPSPDPARAHLPTRENQIKGLVTVRSADYTIKDEKGNSVGIILAEINDEGLATVSHIGAEGGKGSFGIPLVRDILKEFVKANPDVKAIRGERVSGIREGKVDPEKGGPDVVVSVEKIKKPLLKKAKPVEAKPKDKAKELIKKTAKPKKKAEPTPAEKTIARDREFLSKRKGDVIIELDTHADKPLLEQKKALLAAIDKALKTAPTLEEATGKTEFHAIDPEIFGGGRKTIEAAPVGELDTLTGLEGVTRLRFKIPGDGEFLIPNIQQNLQNFEKLVKKGFGKGTTLLRKKGTARKFSGKRMVEAIEKDLHKGEGVAITLDELNELRTSVGLRLMGPLEFKALEEGSYKYQKGQLQPFSEADIANLTPKERDVLEGQAKGKAAHIRLKTGLEIVESIEKGPIPPVSGGQDLKAVTRALTEKIEGATHIRHLENILIKHREAIESLPQEDQEILEYIINLKEEQLGGRLVETKKKEAEFEKLSAEDRQLAKDLDIDIIDPADIPLLETDIIEKLKEMDKLVDGSEFKELSTKPKPIGIYRKLFRAKRRSVGDDAMLIAVRHKAARDRELAKFGGQLRTILHPWKPSLIDAIEKKRLVKRQGIYDWMDGKNVDLDPAQLEAVPKMRKLFDEMGKFYGQKIVKHYAPRRRGTFPDAVAREFAPDEIVNIHRLERTGQMEDVQRDIWTAALGYIRTNANEKHVNPMLIEMAPFLNKLDASRRQIADDWINHQILGVPTETQKALNTSVKKLGKIAGLNLSDRAYQALTQRFMVLHMTGTIAWRLKMVTRNAAQNSLTGVYSGFGNLIKANSMRNTPEGREILEKSAALKARENFYIENQEDQAPAGWDKKIFDVGMTLYRGIDKINVKNSFLAEWINKKGLDETERIRAADLAVANTQYLYGLDMPGIMTGAGKPAFAYWSWPLFFTDFVIGLAEAKNTAAFGRLAAVTVMFWLLKETTGIDWMGSTAFGPTANLLRGRFGPIAAGTFYALRAAGELYLGNTKKAERELKTAWRTLKPAVPFIGWLAFKDLEAVSKGKVKKVLFHTEREAKPPDKKRLIQRRSTRLPPARRLIGRRRSIGPKRRAIGGTRKRRLIRR